MSLLNIRLVRSCTRAVLFILAFFVQVTVHAWDVDLSRRQKDLQNSVGPGVVAEPKTPENPLQGYFEVSGPSQEVVIIQTENGFVPETIRLKKGSVYKLHVVNVNAKAKNVSFIMDAFAEHHGTFFGQDQTFVISPKSEGVFSFQCPETAKQGHLVIYGDEARQPASN